MLKLIWSTFAMSLILLFVPLHEGEAQTEAIDDFLGLESEILPELTGPQRFTKPDLHERKDWKLTTDEVIKDTKEPFWGQGHSIIPWSEIDPEEWLSITTWIAERDTKDTQPNWKINQRHMLHKELTGKVLQCKGACFIYRGNQKVAAQHLSRIHEGDEFHAEENTVAWIFLIDGTLVRISPETSVTFHETNLSLKETFFHLRLNYGHIYWHARSSQERKFDDLPETDSQSLPLMVTEANQEFYERQLFKNESDELRLQSVLNLNDPAVKKQFEKLNQLIQENNPQLKIGTKVLVVTPNSNIVSKNHSFDLVYLFSGKSYFKKRTTEEDKFTLSLRGYASFDLFDISGNEWHEVDADGRNYSKLENPPSSLQILELLTKRIKSLELAREIWIKNFTAPLYKTLPTPEMLASHYGLSLWGEELEARYKFLNEYTRRVETTHLRSIKNLYAMKGMEKDQGGHELSEKLYQLSLKYYLLGLKTRYDKEKIKVKEMNDLQFYVWILRNGKF
jgi:hypothetical protein